LYTPVLLMWMAPIIIILLFTEQEGAGSGAT